MGLKTQIHFLFCFGIFRGLKIEMLQLHIDKLHLYNELKDYAQMVLGRIGWSMCNNEYSIKMKNFVL